MFNKVRKKNWRQIYDRAKDMGYNVVPLVTPVDPKKVKQALQTTETYWQKLKNLFSN